MSVRPSTLSGADLDIRDEDGRTSLLHAARNGYLEPLQVLLKCGAERDISDNDGRTALHWAAAGNKVDCLHALVGAKAALDVQARSREPLRHAVVRSMESELSCRRPAMRPCLPWCLNMSLGLSRVGRAQDREGMTAAIIAAANGFEEALTVLIDAKANLNIQVRERYKATMQHLAALGIHATGNRGARETDDLLPSPALEPSRITRGGQR